MMNTKRISKGFTLLSLVVVVLVVGAGCAVTQLAGSAIPEIVAEDLPQAQDDRSMQQAEVYSDESTVVYAAWGDPRFAESTHGRAILLDDLFHVYNGHTDMYLPAYGYYRAVFVLHVNPIAEGPLTSRPAILLIREGEHIEGELEPIESADHENGGSYTVSFDFSSGAQPIDTLYLVFGGYVEVRTAGFEVEISRLGDAPITPPSNGYEYNVSTYPADIATSADEAQQSAIHVITPGDTLHSIAAEHGVTVDALLLANDLLSPGVLYAGMELVIPPIND